MTDDVEYDALPDGWLPGTLDVYSPPHAAGLPLVVWFHGGGNTKESPPYPMLLTLIAATGAVVVAPNWGPTNTSAAATTTPDALAMNTQIHAEASCAVSFMLDHADEYGIDPTRVVIAGHSGGANVASVVGFTRPTPSEGCLGAPAAWTPTGQVLWEGDMMLADPDPWDKFGDGVGQLARQWTPWGMFDSSDHQVVRLAVTDGARTTLKPPAT